MWEIIVIIFALLLLSAAVLSLANLFLEKFIQNKRLKLRLKTRKEKEKRNEQIRKEIREIAKREWRRLRNWLKIRKRREKPLLFKTEHRDIIDDNKS